MIDADTKQAFLAALSRAASRSLIDSLEWKLGQRLIGNLIEAGMEPILACEIVSQMVIILDQSLDDTFIEQLAQQYAQYVLNVWDAMHALAKSLLDGTPDMARISYVTNKMLVNTIAHRHLVLTENLTDSGGSR